MKRTSGKTGKKSVFQQTYAKQDKKAVFRKSTQNKTKDKSRQHFVKQRVKTFIETKPKQIAKY
jgi:hypothetical protein